MPIRPPDITQKFPSDAMIKRGAQMHVEPQEKDQWLVYQPGHEMHQVKRENHFYICDCVGYQMRSVCAHVAAVRSWQAKKDREDLFGDNQ